jgi:short-subunit dehydrogenase
LETLTKKAIESSINVNLTGLCVVTKHCIPFLRETAKKIGTSRIINMSSMAGVVSLPYSSVYCATKYGVQSITEALRRELYPFGIQSCNVNPGLIDTKFSINCYKNYGNDLLKNEEKLNLYPIFYDNFNYFSDCPEIAMRGGLLPIDVAKIVENCLLERNVKLNYLVGNEKNMVNIVQNLPIFFRDFFIRKFKNIN